ncbi:MAG: FAD:protein FMN transferase [Oscillospiraceae bacterium]|nr:FAD:protein FMN transferase [Oscillospiraceae bacterium]
MLKKWVCVFSALLITLGVSGCRTSGYERFRTELDGLFDTNITVIGYARSKGEFDTYANIIFERMGELHILYDIYNAYDGTNNLHTVNQNAGIAPIEVSGDIIDMLLLAKDGYELSGGTVNIAMGAVLRIWHEYRADGSENPDNAELPPMGKLMEAAMNTDINDLVIDEAAGTVFLRNPGMSLDVGAVAKSYAAGVAAKAVEEAGAESLLLNAGGSVTAIGKPLDGERERWGVGIPDPDLTAASSQNLADTVYYRDLTLSCSGGYHRFYIIDGQKYHHIIDPATLMPATRYKQVAVIHPDSGLADILSTALFILPYEDGAALAERSGAEVLWIDADGNWMATDGYAAMSKELGGYSAVG